MQEAFYTQQLQRTAEAFIGIDKESFDEHMDEMERECSDEQWQHLQAVMASLEPAGRVMARLTNDNETYTRLNEMIARYDTPRSERRHLFLFVDSDDEISVVRVNAKLRDDGYWDVPSQQVKHKGYSYWLPILGRKALGVNLFERFTESKNYVTTILRKRIERDQRCLATIQTLQESDLQ